VTGVKKDRDVETHVVDCAVEMTGPSDRLLCVAGGK